MRVSILYVTFARDVHWLRFSIESIRKYATGFSGITVVVPEWDLKHFLQYERYSTPECPVMIKGFEEHPGKGFVHHLAMKCYADVFCQDAGFILHLDPDCLFTAPVTPEDYFVGGLPVLVIEPYDVLKTIHPARYHWKEVTEAALKFECTHETMCRHPAVHHKNVYIFLREHVEKVHQTPFMDFVLKQKNKYPQGFGEFNTLGAFAYKFKWKYQGLDHHWIDRGDQGDKNDPPSKLEQLWSYTGVNTKENAEKIKQILG